MLKILILFAVMSVSSIAQSEPWVAFGQTKIPTDDRIDNPTPSVPSVIGAVLSLPYVVPTGKKLCINSYGIEGYNSGFETNATIFLWTGPSWTVGQGIDSVNWRINHSFFSVSSSSFSNSTNGHNWCVPAGNQLNVRIVNTNFVDFRFAWFVDADLLPL